VVPAKLAALTFHAALFVPLSRCTKLRGETPMRSPCKCVPRSP
jgi:hypothetical protein